MKVLFIADNQESHPIKKLFQSQFPKIELITPDSNMLNEILTSGGPFSFVVIDIDEKGLNAFELYEKISDTLGLRPFIFIGNANNLKSQITSEILQKTQTNFLIETPLTPMKLNPPIQAAIDWIRKEEFEESVVEFSRDEVHRIRIKNLYLFEQIPYDVFIELTSTKFGKIISKDKPFSHQLIQQYSRRNVKYFYLKKDDHLKFLTTSIGNLIKIYEMKLVDRKKILILHLKTIFFIHQFIKTASVSESIVKLTHLFIDSARDTVKNQEKLIDLLDQIAMTPGLTAAEFSLASSYICESMLHNIGWSADMSRDKLILASILQDIAIVNEEFIPIRSINDPAFRMLSETDQDIIKAHPLKAAQFSTYFSGFSDVDFILSQHHEHPSGGGFPSGTNSSNLTTISCLFIIASNFVSRLSTTGQSPNRYKEIITGMKRIYHTGNFKDPFKGLEKAFKQKNH